MPKAGDTRVFGRPFGLRVARAREAKRWSQPDLAHAARISTRSIAAYETGEAIPRLDVAAAIALALGSSLDDLAAVRPPDGASVDPQLEADLRALEQAVERVRRRAGGVP